MAREVDSGALIALEEQLGLSGNARGITVLRDDDVFQVVDIVAAARRSLADVRTRGLFYAILRTISAAGAPAFVSLDPYAVDQADVLGTWPTPVPEGFDVWLLEASVTVSGGTFTAGDVAVLQLGNFARQQAFGRNSAGAPVSATPAHTLAMWDGVVSDGFTTFLTAEGGALRPTVKIGRRLIPGQQIQVVIDPTGACTCDFQVQLGLFPAGLGQDGSV